MARHNVIGEIGEKLAATWLAGRGHVIIGRNYSKAFGEIDIVTRENSKVHFVEVKSVSYETVLRLRSAVSHETHRPEEMVHTRKQQRMGRAIQTWIAENKWEGEFQIDVISVRMVPREKYAQIELIENVVLE